MRNLAFSLSRTVSLQCLERVTEDRMPSAVPPIQPARFSRDDVTW